MRFQIKLKGFRLARVHCNRNKCGSLINAKNASKFDSAYTYKTNIFTVSTSFQ